MEEKHKINPKEMAKILEEVSFKTNKGEGVRVCYPNEVLLRLYGDDLLKELWIKE